MLTRRQKELLDFITAYCSEHVYAPSYDEMGEALGLKAKSGVNRLIASLEERGFIRRLPNRARAIEIIRPEREALRHLRRVIGALAVSGRFGPDFADAVTDAQEFLQRTRG